MLRIFWPGWGAVQIFEERGCALQVKVHRFMEKAAPCGLCEAILKLLRSSKGMVG
jgi:hypothetical protein